MGQYGYHEIQGRRESMEDAHVALPVPEGTGVDAFFGVFDGHGGSRAAEWVSHNMYSALLNADAFKEGDTARAMHQAFASIEDQFLQIAMDVEDPVDEMHDGTTAVVMALTGNTIHVANVGDSEAVLCHAGEAIKMSETHNPKDSQEETDRILEAGGKIYNRRVGHPVFNPAVMSIAVPHVESRELSEDDTFLILACDGLWDVLTPEDAVRMVKDHMDQGMDPQAIAETMTDWAYANGSTDNITVLLVTFAYHEDGWDMSSSDLSTIIMETTPSTLNHSSTSSLPLDDDDDAIHDEDSAVLIEKLRARIKVLRRELVSQHDLVDSLKQENDQLRQRLE